MHEEMHQAAKIIGGPMAPKPNSPVEVVDIQFHTGAKVYFFNPNGMKIATGDHVIIETARGPEYGTCVAGNHTVPFKDIVPPLRKVLRLANEADEKTLSANRAKEKRAFEVCQQKIQEHKLDMQLVSAEYAFDGSKILFFFTSDDRVDFRELVKHLAGIFRTRIELRQIGVRDKAKMVGGLGICGRPFCCTEFLDDFQPVSIKMAKTQNLSLNPTKISGTCGRLMCCLKYEQDTYESLLRTSPKLDSFVDTPDGRGTVVDVYLLRQRVKVRMEDQPDTEHIYQNEEICVLRNGKAKKNDPPIPADLAPISGAGKRPRLAPTIEEDTPVKLDPIRFRYRPDDIVDEEPDAQQEDGAKHEDHRRKKRQTEHPGKEHPAKDRSAREHTHKEKSAHETPTADAPKTEAAKSNRERRRNKSAHPKQPQSGSPALNEQAKAPKKGSAKAPKTEAKSPKADTPKADAAKTDAATRRKNTKPKSDRAAKSDTQNTHQTGTQGSGQHHRSSNSHRGKNSHRPKQPNEGSAPKQGE